MKKVEITFFRKIPNIQAELAVPFLISKVR